MSNPSRSRWFSCFRLLLPLALTACPGPSSKVDTTPTGTALNPGDQDVSYELSDSFRELTCNFSSDDLNIISDAGSNEATVNMQVMSLALKWENGLTGTTATSLTLSTTELFNLACEDVVADLKSPMYIPPPVGDCPGLAGTNIIVAPVQVTSTMNGALDLLRSATSTLPDGVWCQVTLKDTSRPENLIWAMLFAFNHYHTPALVNWGVTPTLIRAARVRIPSAAVGSFQALMAGTSTTVLVDNYPSLSASILQLDYSTSGSTGSLVGSSGAALAVGDVRTLFGSSGSAIIDPLDGANLVALDEFIGSFIRRTETTTGTTTGTTTKAPDFLTDECLNQEDLSNSEPFQPDPAYTPAEVSCPL